MRIGLAMAHGPLGQNAKAVHGRRTAGDAPGAPNRSPLTALNPASIRRRYRYRGMPISFRLPPGLAHLTAFVRTLHEPPPAAAVRTAALPNAPPPHAPSRGRRRPARNRPAGPRRASVQIIAPVKRPQPDGIGRLRIPRGSPLRDSAADVCCTALRTGARTGFVQRCGPWTTYIVTAERLGVRAARIVTPKAPLSVCDVDSPVPEGEEVVVRVRSAGVCHSDLHLWEGGYDMGDGTFLRVTDRGVRYPVTPGHEIAGTVHEAGPLAKGFSRGDDVLVYPWLGCGACAVCRSGSENVCDTPGSVGLFRDGGYAEFVKVPSHRYLARTRGLDPDEATSLACAALTSYTAVKKAAEGSPDHIVMFGAGGLGLMGVQVAKAITGSRIVCVDLDDSKLETAASMGADATINSRGEEPARLAEKIAAECGGAGAGGVIDFVNAPNTAAAGLASLRKRGSLVLVGLFGGRIELPLVTVPLKSISIRGAYTGTYADMVELIGLAAGGSIRPRIARRYPLEEANAALEDLRARRLNGRAVINP